MEYQQFLNWLKKKKALNLFINEFNKFQQKLENNEISANRSYWMRHAYKKTIEDVFNGHGKFTISFSFRWLDTGNYTFWSNLSEELQDLWNTNNL